jgi:hypothetical protein
MKRQLLLLFGLFAYGCTSIALEGNIMTDPSLRHENSESKLLTEKEFMSRVSKSATLIYEGLRTISEAAEVYAVHNVGQLPQSTSDVVKALLMDGGYLKEWPVVPAFAFASADVKPAKADFVYMNGLDDMDGIGAKDDAIFVQELKIEVCEEFSRLYSSFGPNDIIHDYVADRDRYPGEVIGRHMKAYSITFFAGPFKDSCEVEWIMQYND